MPVVPIPCRTDNYSFWVAERANADECVVVDPCRPEPVLAAVERLGARPVAILNTHHHHDHVGANEALVERYPGLRVYGHVSEWERIPRMTHGVDDGDSIEEAGLCFSVLFIPGHTTGHVAFVSADAAFVGDTLFGAGCGRLLGGTATQLWDSLNNKLAALPGELPLYFCHEYTEANLRFAKSVEPDNEALQRRIESTKSLRAAGGFTVPTTLSLEQATNPFLRVHTRAVRESVGDPTLSPPQVFAALRAMKDHF